MESLLGAPSKVAVLRALLRAEGPLKASDVARRSGVSLPQVLRVLREFRRLGAVSARPTPTAPTYGLVDEVRSAAAALFRLEGAGLEGVEERVTAALVDLGAPLSRPRSAGGGLPPEKALPLAVRLARQDATLLSALPPVLARLAAERRRDRGFWISLHREARREGVERHLGMLLHLCGTLLKNGRMTAEAGRYRAKGGRRTYAVPFRGYFRTPWEKKLAEERTPDVARRWGFRMNVGEADFRHHLGRTD